MTARKPEYNGVLRHGRRRCVSPYYGFVAFFWIAKVATWVGRRWDCLGHTGKVGRQTGYEPSGNEEVDVLRSALIVVLAAKC